ncbi:TetR/AcrR family transcriptional regulator [Rufibacter glacialis]|uniref:TetR/AcrR family transcriptional regulator n=1 Tax=Rufibacter glacialis TaxID=1259555 RepID=A0A5M8Q487_9BACT|nr:TetR/AcrR family transcriptional regulator [Rufibacter glacialis]KAA6430193.1 TetR/AcrR family transcriptional regulator [Rufibacter glacialis]GGK87180.1 TetR family transcriptional regulator [Rufibacter glacialis]
METRDRILHQARALFFQKGIKAVSMDDVAAHLGVSKKTLYKWFANKDEVVLESMQQYIQAVEGTCSQAIASAANAMEAMFQIVEMVRDIMRQMHPSIFYDLQKYHPAAWRLWQEHKNNFFLEQTKEHMQRGIREKLFREDIDVEILARLRLAEVELGFDSENFPATQFDLQKVQVALLEHFILGLATLKGHKLVNQYKQIIEDE